MTSANKCYILSKIIQIFAIVFFFLTNQMDESQSKGPNNFCLNFEHNVYVVLLLKKMFLLYTFIFFMN